MKTNRKRKRQVYVALTERGRKALRSLRRKLQVSQCDAVEFAIIFADGGSRSPDEMLSQIRSRTQEAIENL